MRLAYKVLFHSEVGSPAFDIPNPNLPFARQASCADYHRNITMIKQAASLFWKILS